MEVKKVLRRNKGKFMVKYVIIPRRSNIQPGDLVLIKKIKESENLGTD